MENKKSPEPRAVANADSTLGDWGEKLPKSRVAANAESTLRDWGEKLPKSRVAANANPTLGGWYAGKIKLNDSKPIYSMERPKATLLPIPYSGTGV